MNKSGIISHIHSIVLLYIFFGWMIESQRSILVVLLPTLQFQFLINDNMCILTQLENKFLKEDKDKGKGKGEDKEIIINDSFVDKNLKKCNIQITPKKREIMVHSFTYFMFLFNYFLM